MRFIGSYLYKKKQQPTFRLGSRHVSFYPIYELTKFLDTAVSLADLILPLLDNVLSRQMQKKKSNKTMKNIMYHESLFKCTLLRMATGAQENMAFVILEPSEASFS